MGWWAGGGGPPYSAESNTTLDEDGSLALAASLSLRGALLVCRGSGFRAWRLVVGWLGGRRSEACEEFQLRGSAVYHAITNDE